MKQHTHPFASGIPGDPRNASPELRYRLTVLERECAADDYRTDNGQGMPDEVEAVELETVEATGVAAFEAVLEEHGLSQWDGGSTAYDPDGSHLSIRGIVSERFGRVEIVEEEQ